MDSRWLFVIAVISGMGLGYFAHKKKVKDYGVFLILCFLYMNGNDSF